MNCKALKNLLPGSGRVARVICLQLWCSVISLGFVNLAFAGDGEKYSAELYVYTYDGPSPYSLDRIRRWSGGSFTGPIPFMGELIDPWEYRATETGVEIIELSIADPLGSENDLFYGYADPTGKVRLEVNAIGGLKRLDNGTGGVWRFFDEREAHLRWSNKYTKGSDTAKVTAVILPSELVLSGGQRISLPDTTWQTPYVDMEVEITISVKNKGILGGLTQNVSMEGYPLLFPSEDHFKFIRNGYPDIVAPGLVDGEPNSDPGPFEMSFAALKDRATITIPKQTIELDLSGVEEGEEYRVSYFIRIGAGTWDDTQGARVSFADPISGGGSTGGIEIVVDDEPSTAPYSRACQETLDAERYVDNNDGTATDKQTGLMWHRCPVGYALNDGGTTGDITDDVCVEDAATLAENDWSDSLVAARASRLGGHSDWRLSNVKETESLRSQCVTRSIEPDWFPLIRGNEVYWTSTPSRTDESVDTTQALQVELSDGTYLARPTDTLGLARPVRDSGTSPVATRVAVRALSAAIEEGDTGSGQLAMPVTLSESLDVPVAVDYVISSPNNQATSGVDYVASSGTLNFAPGETRKSVAVTVFGDSEVENTELVSLQLSNSTAGTRIAVPVGMGRILDDEPIVAAQTLAVQVEEGNAGERRVISVPVQLSKPALATTSVDYEVITGTAELGTDIEGASGTVVIAPGSDTGAIELTLIGDDIVENDETITIQFANPVGAKFGRSLGPAQQQLVMLMDDDGPGFMTALNDTAIDECADDVSPVLGCPLAAYPGQDAVVGRDADPVIGAEDVDGKSGFSFTKLDETGTPVGDQFGFSACVRDEVTGLTWEVKGGELGGPTLPDLHQSTHTYTWFNSSGVNDGGDVGIENGGSCSDAVNCDTEKFVAAVNAENFCGFDDWRLPSIEELYSLVHMNNFILDHDNQRFYGNTFFYMTLENAFGRGLWSSTPVAGSDGREAWRLTSFGAVVHSKSSAQRIRLVRGGSR